LAKCVELVLVLRTAIVPLLHVKVQLSHPFQDHCLRLWRNITWKVSLR